MDPPPYWKILSEAAQGTHEPLGALFGPHARCQGFWLFEDPLVVGDGGACPRTLIVQVPADPSGEQAYTLECHDNTPRGLWQAIHNYYSLQFETEEQILNWYEECCETCQELPQLGDHVLYPAMEPLVERGIGIVHEWSNHETVFLDLVCDDGPH